MGENFRGALKLSGIFSILFITIAFLCSIIGVFATEFTLVRFISFFLKTLLHPVSFFLYFICLILPLAWAGIYDLRAKGGNVEKLEKGSD